MRAACGAPAHFKTRHDEADTLRQSGTSPPPDNDNPQKWAAGKAVRSSCLPGRIFSEKVLAPLKRGHSADNLPADPAEKESVSTYSAKGGAGIGSAFCLIDPDADQYSPSTARRILLR